MKNKLRAEQLDIFRDLKILLVILAASQGTTGVLTGCTNSFQVTKVVVGQLPSPSPIPSASPGDHFNLSSVTYGTLGNNTLTPTAGATPTGAGAATPFTLYINSSTSVGSISNHCNLTAAPATAAAKPCACQFTWNESNPNSGLTTTNMRSVQTTVTAVQPYLVTCNSPDVLTTEVVNGTQLRISIVAMNGNPDNGLFTVTPYLYTYSTKILTGSFSDSQGNIYDNILRYSCYQTFQRGMNIMSAMANSTSPAGVAMNYSFGSQFCFMKGSSGTSTGSCTGLNIPKSTGFSTQANYFNLYIRNSEGGNINQNNSGFTCPLVKEALNNTGTTGTLQKFWPKDTTFALSLGPSQVFTVGVSANLYLSNSGDALATNNNTCYPVGTPSPGLNAGHNAGLNGGGAAAAAGPFISGCLGFAAPPATDGTCPSIRDANNQVLPTFRLRRYVAIYPRLFDTDGSVFANTSQGLDSVYVLDRPVNNPANTNTSKPVTIAGPKPCPFAYFDQKKVTQPSPSQNPMPPLGYVATNDPRWNGKNVDGIEFPNMDGIDSTINPSCSATLPILSKDHTAFSFQTININNTHPGSQQHAYIRPTDAFTPYYVEDTRFLACAPQANPFQDPPLHFARDPVSGNVAWCAETYPSQYDYVPLIDPPKYTNGIADYSHAGYVAPFTSHTQKNTASSACTFTALTTIPTPTSAATTYGHSQIGSIFGSAHNPAYANHAEITDNPYTLQWDATSSSTLPYNSIAKTCDRTVQAQSNNPPPVILPLLARAGDVEAALQAPATTASFQCTITYDPNGKVGTPSSGCCDPNSVSVQSDKSTPPIGHLEPDVPCKVPNY